MLSRVSESDERLMVRTEEAHPYAGISVEEWGAANCRLLYAMISDRAIDMNDIPYYLAYTATIFDFATKYELHSVLDYDHQYRERQAQHSFTWGSLNPNAELQLLQRVRTPYNVQPKRHQQQNHKDYQPTDVCRQWLARGVCQFGSACRYRHTPSVSSDNTYPFPKNSQTTRPSGRY